MAVFLVQVSGAKSEHEETGASWWWQEPIEKGVYINYSWKERSRAEVWESIREGDKVLIYCTGNVEPYPSQLAHIFTVSSVELTDEKAVLRLKERTELPQGMSRDVIMEKVQSGELSKGMGKCGTQGFNIGKVEDSDLAVILKWSQAGKELKEGIGVSRESDLLNYFVKYPEKLEKGLRLIDPQEALPEGAGIPDLLCKDSNGNYVVVELKAGEASYDALGQIASYKGAVIEKTGSKVRGIIVASSFDHKILFGTRIIDSQGFRVAELKRYLLNFDLEEADG